MHGELHFDGAHVYGQNAESKYGRYKFGEPALPIWPLGDTDAVLWVGCTAPPCEYFSFRTYLKGEWALSIDDREWESCTPIHTYNRPLSHS